MAKSIDFESHGRIIAVCVSKEKGVAKEEVESVSVLKDWGVEGDAHAGKWNRQVSALAVEDICRIIPQLGSNPPAGLFAENLLIEGIETASLMLGSVLETSSGVLLKLSQIGKRCHEDCSIKQRTGKCAMPQKGLFFTVLRGGRICKGDKVRLAYLCSAAVIVVSDSCFYGTRKDESGEAVAAVLGENGFDVIAKDIVPDDADAIRERITSFCGGASADVGLVLTVGGTGLSPSDVTPEATLSVLERRAEGLTELMRAASGKVNPNAYLSRGVAGVVKRTLIVNLPGSVRGARESLDAVLAVLPHALRMLRGSTAHSPDRAGR